eukprot:702546-Prymnesium_polylepis.1
MISSLRQRRGARRVEPARQSVRLLPSGGRLLAGVVSVDLAGIRVDSEGGACRAIIRVCERRRRCWEPERAPLDKN